jgi:neurofibromin 1
MEAEIRELLIQGSASLIAANPEIGLKHSLHYAYDQDLKKRATFARIFARMLEAGMRFDAPPLTTKQSTLCEVSSFFVVIQLVHYLTWS